MELRPLDRVGSIKVKLGVLVAGSATASALVVFYGLFRAGWLPRYTLPVSVLAALIVTQVLARGMTSPLRELTAAARAMARGDYSRRVRATSRDEVGEAARAFNTMAEDLSNVDRQRRELVANVSHELRTPISALRAVLENLVDGVTPPDEATLRAALDQTERLGRLVEELLDLSRVDSGIPLERRDVPLREALDSAVGEAKVARRPVRWNVEVEPPELSAFADGARLHQVLTNLLDNASRHSPAGGTVTARASARTGGGVRLEISDDGPGIAPADRARVFERFHRGGAHDAADATGGTGLGLAIVRWAVELPRRLCRGWRTRARGARSTSICRVAPCRSGSRGPQRGRADPRRPVTRPGRRSKRQLGPSAA